MRTSSARARDPFWPTVAMFLTAIAGLHFLSHGEAVLMARPLATIPLVLGAWEGHDAPFEARMVKALAVDDYLSRFYVAGDRNPMWLYIGYYKSQRTGETIHSPKNCLPGAGWGPVHAGHVRLQQPNGPSVLVNLYVIQKGLERKLVIYWYQSHGRSIASEYWAKIYMVWDAIRMNRTDSALVRITTPLEGNQSRARQSAIAFAEQVLAELDKVIPR